MKTLLKFCLEQKLVVLLLLSFLIGWGIRVAPFDWEVGWMKRDPVAVDAIPDLGDNQQIVFTEWPGRSPRDVEDQISYPLTVSLLGVPGVKEVRTYSFFGFSSIYLIFEEDIEFHWSRSRILEKLNSLPSDLLPDEVAPRLGPDATALGQVFWYTLEGRDREGRPAGGWDLDELRAIQDFQVRYALTPGVAEVASVGGFVREYQVDVDPDRLRAHDVTLPQVVDAVRKSNRETGARNLEINGVEYLVRGLGFIKEPDDLRKAVVAVRNHTPITIADVAEVKLGPAMRRGALDKNGAEAVGGVVISRFGENPLETIKETKAKITRVSEGLPERAVIDWSATSRDEVEAFAKQQGLSDPFTAPSPETEINQPVWLPWTKTAPREDWPGWLNTSKVTVVPFYDRSKLIAETLGTLEDALFQQILITIIVVVIMVMHLRTAVLISSMLPLAVLGTFITMKLFGVDANVVALAGIAIAIGTVVDVGIVLTENVLKHLGEAKPGERTLPVILRGTHEVAGAVTTAVLTTVISFLPVFALTGEAGRLFRPLAFTKTFALIASLIVALTIIPPLAHLFFGRRVRDQSKRSSIRNRVLLPLSVIVAAVVGWLLAGDWAPLGLDRGQIANFLFVGLILAVVLVGFRLFQFAYAPILRWTLAHKAMFLTVPSALLLLALCIWLGFGSVFSFVPKILGNGFKETALWTDLDEKLPGLSSEFRPRLDEGTFLFMPTTSPHASIGEAMDSLKRLDAAISSVPEVSMVVGKIGRVESSLDPAPISMIESVIHYYPEYRSDENGRPIKFRYDRKEKDHVYGRHGDLIPDPKGRPFRQWRSHIRTPRDIWSEIEKVAKITGTTGAPLLQPIETRLVMLQTGMRAPMGLKVRAPSLETLEAATLELEKHLKEGNIPGLNVATINADRIIGKPYLEIEPDRETAQRFGLNVGDLVSTIQTAIGGLQVTTTVEGRERFAVRVRYQRERRNTIEAMERILVTAANGTQVPLSQVANIRYVRGPQMIKSEDTFLTSYITFGNDVGFTDVDVVEDAQVVLDGLRESGALHLPTGVTWEFAGSYKQKRELDRTLLLVVPISLFAIFILLYLQFRSTVTTLIIFSAIAVAWSGGFLLLWLYGQPGFLDFELFGANLADLFNVHPVALSAAVWVGFLALFGIATDDGVVMTTYLRQLFNERNPKTREEIRETVVAAGLRRVRPCLMTTATTLLALLPVLTSTGKGSDIMGPMAVPIFGGMTIELLTMFVVPVLYCTFQELKIRFISKTQ